jgi:hypothetical protein
MIYAFALVASYLFNVPAHADSALSPPAELTRATYLGWLSNVGSNVSPFYVKMMDWYDEQLRTALPAAVYTDPDKLYVTVDRPLRETIELEQAGEIEEGNTVGFEAYGVLDVPIAVALETKLFTWGKPIGKREGDTYPMDTVFSNRHDILTERWGPGNYFSRGIHTGGGIVQDLRDDYSVLVRSDGKGGYVMYNAYYGPSGDTASIAHISIVTLAPTADGKTEFRQCVRQNGQSYKVFGLDYGRRNFGFNVSRFRQGEKQLTAQMVELKNTGKIKENRP